MSDITSTHITRNSTNHSLSFFQSSDNCAKWPKLFCSLQPRTINLTGEVYEQLSKENSALQW